MPQVRRTAEFERVEGLPRRVLNEAHAAAWAAELDKDLRLPGGTMRLGPWQGFSLAEVVSCRGGFLGLPVGLGKTLITFLLPTLFESLHPVLVIPPSLVDKTWADFTELSKHFVAPRSPWRVVTPNDLQPEEADGLLEALGTDLVIVDECDDLQNPQAAACRKLDRFKAAHNDVPYVLMTGTPGRKSIMNYWHLLCWALTTGAPMPLSLAEAKDWAQALDYRKNPFVQVRMKPGPLGHDTEGAREWYADRLAQTPGVILIDGDSCKAPLTIRLRKAREDVKLDQAYKQFLTTLETPSGESVADPLSRWRIDGQFGCGLYTKWKKPPPDAWRHAYQAKNRFVRKRIQETTNSSHPLDTEGAVLRRHADFPAVKAWRAVEPTFDTGPANQMAVWLSDSTILSARDWLAESSEPGVIWCGSVEFAEALSVATRLPYYSRQGRNQFGQGLHVADTSKSLIASWYANKKGFNLQAWRRQAIVMPPQSSKWLEQIFGRPHRQGQDQAVTFDIIVTSGGTLDAFAEALREARFNVETLRMTQKILRADIQWCTPKVTPSNRFRWARKADNDAADDRAIGKAFRSALRR